jgi:hypothetical protein
LSGAIIAHQPAAQDRIAGGIDDDAGDHGHAALRRLHRRRHQLAVFLVVERMPLAGRAACRQAMAARPNEPVDLRRHQLEIDLAVLPERRRHRRDHPGRSYLHEKPSLFPCP